MAYYLSADIKYMPKGIYDYEFLLIAVREVTGFVIAIPLIKHNAVSIAHALFRQNCYDVWTTKNFNH